MTFMVSTWVENEDARKYLRKHPDADRLSIVSLTLFFLEVNCKFDFTTDVSLYNLEVYAVLSHSAFVS